MDILYLDNHLLVTVKPAGMLAQADSTGDDDLLTQAKAYLKARFDKPGNVFLGLVHRLDRPVSGVMVFSRTSKSAARLSAQFRNRTVEKRYVAMVEGRVGEPLKLRHHLRKRRARTEVVRKSASGAKEALLTCEPMLVVGDWSLLEISLKTGRPHQIRAQLAEVRHPIVGDVRYGAKKWREKGSIALHCWQMGLEHPTRREFMSWRADPPASWPNEVSDYLSSLPNYLASDTSAE